MPDIARPFDNAVRPDLWTPAQNEAWMWGVDRISGVNFGRPSVIEPFIVPQLSEQDPGTVDE